MKTADALLSQECHFVFIFSQFTTPEPAVSLTLKAPITTAAEDIHLIFFQWLSEKIRLDVSAESSARQRIHMKHQALFSSKSKSKKNKVSSAAIFVWRFKG